MCRAAIAVIAGSGSARSATLAKWTNPSLKEDSSVANIKSQIKRIRTNEKARLRNKEVKTSLKTATRKFNEAVESGNVTEAQAAANDACRQLDKASSKGVIHKNQAAKRKSAIATKAATLA